MNPTDPRVLRTRARLFDSALALVAEREPSRISMSDVARHSGINRATLYLHFQDLDELLAAAMDEAVDLVAEAARVCPLDAVSQAAPRPLVELFEHVDRHTAVYRRMLGPGGNPRFTTRLRERLTRALEQRFARGARPPATVAVPDGVAASFYAGALVGVIADWCRRREPEPAAAIAAATWRLIRGGGVSS